MPGWLDRFARWRRARTLAKRAIPDALWQSTLSRYPFLTWRSKLQQQRLRETATLFLDRKEFSGAGGLEVTDEMAVAIAAQASVPVLALGLACYDRFVGIVVHDDAVAARRSVVDDVGVVHEYVEELAGEAMDGGPLMLSWRDVAEAGDTAEWGYNVVIHEFVHVLDLHAARNARPDGFDVTDWSARLAVEFERFARRVERDEETLFDPYGAEAIEEFFAVAAEVFFVAPDACREEEPTVYGLLQAFFRQNPAADRAAEASREARGHPQRKGSRSSLS